MFIHSNTDDSICQAKMANFWNLPAPSALAEKPRTEAGTPTLARIRTTLWPDPASECRQGTRRGSPRRGPSRAWTLTNRQLCPEVSALTSFYFD